jgi:gamma-glutamyl-gamma-aminobutyraldehyde dehydrogenase
MKLQTLNDVTRLAHELQLADKAFINGGFVPARSGKTLATRNPATGEVIGNIAACDATDVNAAVSAARAAFEAGSWSKRSPGERKAVLLKLAALMEQELDRWRCWKASTAVSRSASVWRWTCRKPFMC